MTPFCAPTSTKTSTRPQTGSQRPLRAFYASFVDATGCERGDSNPHGQGHRILRAGQGANPPPNKRRDSTNEQDNGSVREREGTARTAPDSTKTSTSPKSAFPLQSDPPRGAR